MHCNANDFDWIGLLLDCCDIFFGSLDVCSSHRVTGFEGGLGVGYWILCQLVDTPSKVGQIAGELILRLSDSGSSIKKT